MENNDNLEKAYQVGTIREFGGRKYIKTPTGWKYYGKGTGAKAQSHKRGPSQTQSSQSQPSDPWQFRTADFKNHSMEELQGEYTRARNVYDNTPPGGHKNRVGKFLDDMRAFIQAKTTKPTTYADLSDTQQSALKFIVKLEGISITRKIDQVEAAHGVSRAQATQLLADAEKEIRDSRATQQAPSEQSENANGGTSESQWSDTPLYRATPGLIVDFRGKNYRIERMSPGTRGRTNIHTRDLETGKMVKLMVADRTIKTRPATEAESNRYAAPANSPKVASALEQFKNNREASSMSGVKVLYDDAMGGVRIQTRARRDIMTFPDMTYSDMEELSTAIHRAGYSVRHGRYR